jgi:hypothetical protein
MIFHEFLYLGVGLSFLGTAFNGGFQKDGYLFDVGLDREPNQVLYGRSALRKEVAIPFPYYSGEPSPLAEMYFRSIKLKELRFLGSESVYGLGVNYKYHLKSIPNGVSADHRNLFLQESFSSVGPSITYMLPIARWSFLRWTADIDFPFGAHPIKWNAMITISFRN